ncbi:hypothetical protein B7494_g4976 [Chlorociboria aeruginascens]|nr:hypothetical protein B7494_g4976 [Chlorociboria aeruginascens]
MSDPPRELASATCAHCRRPATLFCRHCRDIPASIPATTYCSAACHAADRRTLYRAGDTLQQLFYMYREKMFDKWIVRIEERGGNLYIYEAEADTVKSDLDYFLPFPGRLCSDDRWVKQALLTYLAGADAVAWMHDCVEHVLGRNMGKRPRANENTDMPFSFRELVIITKNDVRSTIEISPVGEERNTVPTHRLLQVEVSESGERYALDLAGAQYGYYDAVTPWEEYAEKRVLSIVDCREDMWFGAAKAAGEAKVNESSCDGDISRINCECSKSLVASLGKWEADRGILTKTMLGLPKLEYEELQMELVGFVATQLQQYLDFVRGEAVKTNGRGTGRFFK